MANEAIRRNSRIKGVKLWELADALSVSEATITRLLRRELPVAEREQLLRLISEIAQKKERQRNE